MHGYLLFIIKYFERSCGCRVLYMPAKYTSVPKKWRPVAGIYNILSYLCPKFEEFHKLSLCSAS